MTVTVVVVTRMRTGVPAWVRADAEVVQAAGVAQGEFAELVDGVVADAEVCGGCAPAGWLWVGRGRPGLVWCRR